MSLLLKFSEDKGHDCDPCFTLLFHRSEDINNAISNELSADQHAIFYNSTAGHPVFYSSGSKWRGQRQQAT